MTVETRGRRFVGRVTIESRLLRLSDANFRGRDADPTIQVPNGEWPVLVEPGDDGARRVTVILDPAEAAAIREQSSDA